MRLTRILLIGAIVLPISPAVADDEEAATSPWTLSGSIAAATDYIYHGVSQTGGTGAWQGSLTLSGPSGFYGNIWTSRVRYPSSPDTFAEVDFIVGWNGNVGELNVDLSGDVVYYPSDLAHPGYDNTEFFATVTREFESLEFSFTAGYSPDFSYHSGTWLTAEADVSVPLRENLSAIAGIGYETIEDNAAYGLPDYYEGKIGLQYVLDSWTLDGTLSWTGISRTACGGTDLCAPRFTGSLTYAF